MKKDIPLALLEALQPEADNNLDYVKVVKDYNVMFHFIEKDENSKFYFKVIKQEIQNAKIKYLVEYKPQSREFVNNHSSWLELDLVKEKLKNWLEFINAYNKIQTVYDDPILNCYQQRFTEQFKILDADADYVPFDLPQQLFLEEYLNRIQSRLISLKEGRSEKEILELTEIEEDAKNILKVISRETKSKVFKSLTWLFAKMQKEGPYLIREFLIEMSKEIGKKLIIGGM